MIRQAGICLVLILCVSDVFPTDRVFRLPNISQIDDQELKSIGVDRFFSLFSVFTNDNVVVSDEQFTIFAPSGNVNSQEMSVIETKEQLEQLLLNHIILGSRIDPSNITDGIYKTAGGQLIHVTSKDGKFLANSAGIIESKVVSPNGVLIVIDSYLFLDKSELNEEMKNKTLEKPAAILPLIKRKEQDSKTPEGTASFMENVLQVLSYLKSGVRVFHHFLSRSNVSKLIKEDEEYTVLVPTDHAFHRWHPIDWGFYPFSVPEFTENIIMNHFVKGNYRQEIIRDGDVLKTLGDQDLLFRKNPTLTVNGILVVKGDTPLKKGNIMFIAEVLFVNESVVSRLHQQHRDKETPPLLAFPWFGAQFLSHAFLALERDNRFKQITRFLNLADLAPHVSGTGYTFFVPTDKAFEELGLDKMPDNYLSNSEGLQILLNHFVKGRLYDKDLKDSSAIQTLGNKSIIISRENGRLTVNNATVIESEVFVYNLGTMYYVDKLLFINKNLLSGTTTTKLSATTQSSSTSTAVDTITEETSSDAPELFTTSVSDAFTMDPDSVTIEPSGILNVTQK
ncbi:transforming growth factor-beta-induced protein ig-h3 [Agrilus planipennis]|uniref:Transforming growth factor-beta-induced protein ig-h3 n=1 Tax=Agrilus planipennis TaxID=224129 RepID=A0A1W4WNF1_AGRPL|nr:transforming growth factor-beta-induced protein ig-h3 [Agrilus planipennis]